MRPVPVHRSTRPGGQELQVGPQANENRTNCGSARGHKPQAASVAPLGLARTGSRQSGARGRPLCAEIRTREMVEQANKSATAGPTSSPMRMIVLPLRPFATVRSLGVDARLVGASPAVLRSVASRFKRIIGEMQSAIRPYLGRTLVIALGHRPPPASGMAYPFMQARQPAMPASSDS